MLARKLPEGSQVSLETAENRMDIKAGRSRFKLPTLPRDDFPTIVEGDLPTSFELPAKTLAELIDRTRFAISTEETATTTRPTRFGRASNEVTVRVP